MDGVASWNDLKHFEGDFEYVGVTNCTSKLRKFEVFVSSYPPTKFFVCSEKLKVLFGELSQFGAVV